MTDLVDLTDRLADAARESVLARRTAIEAGSANDLRAITTEIELSGRGAVLNVETHLSWRSVIRRAGRPE